MKKVLVLGMVVVMSLAALAGCGQSEQQSGDVNQQPQVESQVQESESAVQPSQEQQGVIVEDGVVMDPSQYDLISEDEARQIAVSNLQGAVLEDIKVIDLDYDDGFWVFEGEIIQGEWEYEFEINAESGDVISWEKDHIYD